MVHRSHVSFLLQPLLHLPLVLDCCSCWCPLVFCHFHLFIPLPMYLVYCSHLCLSAIAATSGCRWHLMSAAVHCLLPATAVLTVGCCVDVLPLLVAGLLSMAAQCCLIYCSCCCCYWLAHFPPRSPPLHCHFCCICHVALLAPHQRRVLLMFLHLCCVLVPYMFILHGWLLFSTPLRLLRWNCHCLRLATNCPCQYHFSIRWLALPSSDNDLSWCPADAASEGRWGGGRRLCS